MTFNYIAIEKQDRYWLCERCGTAFHRGTEMYAPLVKGCPFSALKCPLVAVIKAKPPRTNGI